jgi:ribosomal protein L37E
MCNKQICKRCGKNLQENITKYCITCAINNYNKYKYGILHDRKLEREVRR